MSQRGGSARLLLRFAGRLATVSVAILILLMVSVQFTRIIGQNVAMARELSSVRNDITTLRLRREREQREIERLESPDGAIPEIHERLRLVRPNEVLIFVSPAPAQTP
jgi:cell division protein FtsB